MNGVGAIEILTVYHHSSKLVAWLAAVGTDCRDLSGTDSDRSHHVDRHTLTPGTKEPGRLRGTKGRGGCSRYYGLGNLRVVVAEKTGRVEEDTTGQESPCNYVCINILY